jgi:shikimate kinase
MYGVAKLIILRGNSGSGKTTKGKHLQRKFGSGTMLISQDIVRREMLFVKDGPNPEASQLLLDEFKGQIFAYYLDIPFEETLNRHQQKPNAHEFGEKEMREWWNEKDLLDIIPEVLLYKELSLNEIVDIIYQDVIK